MRIRPFKPAAFALTIVTLATGVTYTFLDTQLVIIGKVPLGGSAIMLASLLTAGWAVGSVSILRAGLLLATLFWVSVCVSLGMSKAPVSTINALGWAILAAGSFWLEHLEDDDDEF